MHNVGSEASCCSCCCGVKLFSSGWVKLLGLVHWCVKGVLMFSLLRLLGWQSGNWQLAIVWHRLADPRAFVDLHTQALGFVLC